MDNNGDGGTMPPATGDDNGAAMPPATDQPADGGAAPTEGGDMGGDMGGQA